MRTKPAKIQSTARTSRMTWLTTAAVAAYRQSVIDVIGEHYLHLAREWGWNDTEVRDAMYVETKQRGWCRE